MKSADGRDAENIIFGSTLSNDQHSTRTFDYCIANPPYGKDWKRDKEAVEEEHERGFAGRFGAGLPRISDGQLLFLQTMLAHMLMRTASFRKSMTQPRAQNESPPAWPAH
jgi:type I restriction enzyme M protein